MRGGEGTKCYDTFRMVDHTPREENRAVTIIILGAEIVFSRLVSFHVAGVGLHGLGTITQ
jgi:hypothetical protein